MDNKRTTDLYDDGNIPGIDLPGHSTGDLELRVSDRFYENEKDDKQKNSDTASASVKSTDSAERLPESTRPRQDGPGGA
ncbi:MAG: hypothetical protein E7286_08620 [Lachnospiraceae bacterium]|nr:hypothetical protein [Lachnospiraceae bacterium]